MAEIHSDLKCREQLTVGGVLSPHGYINSTIPITNTIPITKAQETSQKMECKDYKAQGVMWQDSTEVSPSHILAEIFFKV